MGLFDGTPDQTDDTSGLSGLAGLFGGGGFNSMQMLGLLQGLGAASAPSRLPVTFGQGMGDIAQGLMQGQQAQLQQQTGQQDLALKKIQLQQAKIQADAWARIAAGQDPGSAQNASTQGLAAAAAATPATTAATTTPTKPKPLPDGTISVPSAFSTTDAIFAGGVDPSLVQTAESANNPNAVSAKGAKGVMQVLDTTNTDPGFGVTPAKDNSPAERARVGRDYLAKLQDYYSSPTLGLIAYNWGPGNTNMWLRGGGDPSKLPAETQAYVAGIAKAQAAKNQPQLAAADTSGSDPRAPAASGDEPPTTARIAAAPYASGEGPPVMPPQPQPPPSDVAAAQPSAAAPPGAGAAPPSGGAGPAALAASATAAPQGGGGGFQNAAYTPGGDNAAVATPATATAPAATPAPKVSAYGNSALTRDYMLAMGPEKGMEMLFNREEVIDPSQYAAMGIPPQAPGTMLTWTPAKGLGSIKTAIKPDVQALQHFQEIKAGSPESQQFGWLGGTLNTMTGEFKPFSGQIQGIDTKVNDVLNGSSLTGDAFLKAIPQDFAGRLKQIKDGDVAPPSALFMRTPGGIQVMNALSRAYGTDYTGTEFAQKQNAIKNFVGGPGGKVFNSISRSAAHIQELRNFVLALKNGKNQFANALRSDIMTWSGGADPTNLSAIADIASGEVSTSTIGGGSQGGGTGGDRETIRSRMPSTIASPDQALGVIDKVVTPMIGDNINALRRQWISNHLPAGEFVGHMEPDAQVIYQNHRTPDFPSGVFAVRVAYGPNGKKMWLGSDNKLYDMNGPLKQGNF